MIILAVFSIDMTKKSGMFERIYSMVRKIPRGKVASYGMIASMVSTPRAARIVGYALHQLPANERKVPWWRVVNREGLLTTCTVHVAKEQARRLRKEGVRVMSQGALAVDLKKYIWKI